MIYNTVGCGGTFDRLHAGHQAFLRFVFSHGKEVIIGVTSDAYVAQFKKEHRIEPYEIRRQALENFLQAEGFTGRFTITPIDTLFGPAIDPHIPLDCLVTTEETQSGAEEINAKRKSLGLSILPIITMPLVLKNGRKISSTRIRAGEIDTEGNAYVVDFSNELLLLPETLRAVLQKPFGTLFTQVEGVFKDVSGEMSVVVGDATAAAFHSRHIYPKIAVVDFVVQREKTYASLSEEGFTGKEKCLSVLNPPGSLTPDLWKAIGEVVRHLSEEQTYVITVDGEEDLAVLPLILMLPLGFRVYYGQPQEGIVSVSVDQETKEKVKSLLWQFKRA